MTKKEICTKSCNWLISICLLSLCLVFQGCPHEHHINTNRDAFIYAPMDSIYVRMYNTKGIYYKEEYILPPISPPDARKMDYRVDWYGPEKYDKSVTYDEELHNLHVRRITEKGECYVLLTSTSIKINGITYFWREFYWPSYKIVNGDTVYKQQPPCTITQAIDTLKRYYPDRVIAIHGKEEYSIYNPFLNGDWPSITIK